MSIKNNIKAPKDTEKNCKIMRNKNKNIIIHFGNPKSIKSNFIKGFSEIIKLILFSYIFILLPNEVMLLNKHYIEIKVNKEGYNQIISDEYIGILPDKIINKEGPLFTKKNKIVYINSINDNIILEWKSSLNNFSYMFNNLININSIKMYHMFGTQSNFSFMFNNCYNLEDFTYITSYDDNSIKDLSGMFYNCSSLKFFQFHDLNTNYTYINMSYMFKNCEVLNSISFDSNNLSYINDMKGTFYNCFSLTSIDLTMIKNDFYIDASYLFYNCKKLTSINYIYFNVKEIKYMFFNCNSLKTIVLSNFIPISNYMNLSFLFYNCSSLENVTGDLTKFYINDTREMFHNCISLNSISIYPFLAYDRINMSKMFYNCSNLKDITFDIYNNSKIYSDNDYKFSNCYYFYPNDLSSIFYNCTSLTNIYYNFFRTDFVIDISYMFYNCSKLNYWSLTNTHFYNNLTTNMRGVFQNCESLISINLSFFHTQNAEIMWDMFKGCSGLSYLDLGSFNTSKVTDMESMFEGCSNLTSISLTSFNTNNVNYMNKMFKDCNKLETINFKYISSNSLGTMHKMFYNCNSLKYLNIYNLTEKDQSLEEMFEGVSQSFTFCIKDHTAIPNIFRKIYGMENTIMDCSQNCYGYTRLTINESKICCIYYEYNGNCYNKCPGRTIIENIDKSNVCKNFSCNQYYYNYQQDGCLKSNIIPDGYYKNDTILKTIDKCNNTCKTCDSKTNCLTCDENYPYLFFGKCVKTCKFGHYIDSVSGIMKCKCISTECGECIEESMEEGLCLSCAEGYYPKSDEIIYKEGFKKCYKDPPNYYLDQKNNIYKRCYSTCEKCYGDGNEENHNCITCDTNYTVESQTTLNGHQSKNCYINCTYYFYFDGNQYKCTNTSKCPSNYKYLIPELRQCIKLCSESSGYEKIFRGKCYKNCPPEESRQSEDNPNFCKTICSIDEPFEMVETQTCVPNCTIMDRRDKLCVTNYEGNKTISQLQNLVQTDIMNDITRTFNYSKITNNETVMIDENGTLYEIISSKNKDKQKKTSSIELGECENILKDYYNIDKNASLYIFKIDADIQGKTGPSVIYQVFYPINDPNKLEKLDLTICEGNAVNVLFPIDLENPELYDKDSPYYKDICYPSSSDNKYDMILEDRKQDYSDNNKSLCEEGCEYIGYDPNNKQVECSCGVKLNMPLISEIKIDKNKLYKFMDFKTIANFDFLKCINLAFSKDGLIKNIGFYAFLPTVLMYFVCTFVFYKIENNIIKKDINDLIYAKNNLKYLQKPKKKKNGNKKEKEKPIKPKKKYEEPIFVQLMKLKYMNENNIKSKNKRNEYMEKKIREKSTKISLNKSTIKEEIAEENIDSDNKDSEIKNNDEENNINNEKIDKKTNLTNGPPKKNYIHPIAIRLKRNNDINLDKNHQSSVNNKLSIFKNNLALTGNETKNDKNVKLNKKEEERIRKTMEYNDSELNDMPYKDALKYDHRSYIQYYISLLKTNHLLFKVMNKNDYNSRVIKIYLFFFNFSFSYAVNALFFNDQTMHKIFLDEGKFNFIYQLPQIVYSAAISFICSLLLDFLALSESNILDFKQKKLTKNVAIKAQDLLRVLFCKFINFFIISFVFILIFWYYITCFCAVYKNTQYHLIKDTLISFGGSLITPLGFSLIPGIFRIAALKKKSSILFKFSKALQMIGG